METKDKISALSDIGYHRKNNEDVAYVNTNQYGSILLVADGMGGHRKGEVASKLVLDNLAIPFLNYHKKFNTRRAKKFLKKYMKKANNEIYKLSLSGEEYMEMGTTAVSCIVGEKESVVFSVGDSRCYIISSVDNSLKQITKDQTYGQLLFDAGQFSKADLMSQPQRNLLINAVGINPELTNAEEFVLTNSSYNSILLCSDGLYNMVSDSEIQEIMLMDVSTSEKTKLLIEKALANGGEDNVACSILDK